MAAVFASSRSGSGSGGSRLTVIGEAGPVPDIPAGGEFHVLLPKRQRLFPHQYEGIRWLARRASLGLGCILADEMGLGKTMPATTPARSR